jgi:hypothetical protein
LISFELGKRVRTIIDILVIIPCVFGAFRMKTAAKIGLYDKDTLTEDFAHTKNSVYNYDFGRLNENVAPLVPSSLLAHFVPP